MMLTAEQEQRIRDDVRRRARGMTRVLSPGEWAEECAKTDPKCFRSMSLNEFAELCNRVNRYRCAAYPGISFANKRYAVHLNLALAAGLDVPLEYVRAVTADDIRFDAFAFPFLRPLLEGGASC